MQNHYAKMCGKNKNTSSHTKIRYPKYERSKHYHISETGNKPKIVLVETNYQTKESKQVKTL